MTDSSTLAVPEDAPCLAPGLHAVLAAAAERHEDMASLVSGLPDGALDWLPAEAATSLAGLALHIIDVETHIAALARGEDDGWAGENGSRTAETAIERELLEAIAAAGPVLASALAAMDWGGPGASGVLADLDHVAMHHGQMQLTRHLWEEAHPDAASEYEHWR